MTTKWRQCPDCEGLGKDCNQETCRKCNGALNIPTDTGTVELPSEEDLRVPDDLMEWYKE